MQLDLFEIVLMLGIIQGIFLSVILFTNKSNQPANRLLSMVMFFLSVEIFYMLIRNINLIDNFLYLTGLFFTLPFIYIPLLYLYVKELTTKERNKNFDLLHFVPGALCILFFTFTYFVGDVKLKVFLMKIHNDDLVFTQLINNLKPVYAVVYIPVILILIKKHNRILKESFSNLDKINLNWLRNLSIALIIITIITVLQNISELIYNEVSILLIYLFVSIVILIYAIGYMGLKQPEIFSQTYREDESKRINTIKYKKSGLDPKLSDEYLNRLLTCMKIEKPYLRGELTLQELANLCDVSLHNLSEIINSQLNQNYYDFVNKYRVDEFISKLKDEKNGKFTILSLAYDCGFNSKSSFNTIFKKFTKKTPSEYRKHLGSKDKI